MSLNYLPFLLFILLAVACSSGSGKKDEPADPSADTSDASDGRTINAEKNGLTMFIPNSGLEGSTEASIEQTDPEKVHTALDDLDLPIELPEGSTVLASMNISLGKSGETFKVKAQITAALPASALPASALPASALPASIAAGALPASALPASALPASALPASYLLKLLSQDASTDESTEWTVENVQHIIKSFYLLLGPKGNLLSAPIKGELSWDAEQGAIVAHLRPQHFDSAGMPGGTQVLVVLVLMERGRLTVRLGGVLLDDLSDEFTVFVAPTPTNRPPTVDATTTDTVAEGETKTITLAATDPDGQPVTITADKNLPAFATLTGDTLTVEPGYKDAGTFTFVLTYQDNATPPAKATQTVTLTVTDVNQPPVFMPLDADNLYETQPMSLEVAPLAIDPDGDTLVYSFPDLPAFVTYEKADGLLVFTPELGNAGTYTLTFHVSDNRTPTPLTAEYVYTLNVLVYPRVTSLTFTTLFDTAEFVFDGNLDTLAFTCELDGVVINPCTSPYPLSGLAEGAHTFEVFAKDGDRTSEVQTRTWTVSLPPQPKYFSVLWDNAAPTGSFLHDIHGRSSDDVWAVGGNGQVLHYNGSTWITEGIGAMVDLWDVYAIGENTAIATGLDDVEGRSVVYSCAADPSVSCQRIFLGHPYLGDLSDVWANGPNELYFAGTTGSATVRSGTGLPYVLHYKGTNYFDGTAWVYHTTAGDVTNDASFHLTKDLPAVPGNLKAIHGIPGVSPTIVAVGEGGRVLRKIGTQAWTSLANAATFDSFTTGSDLVLQAVWIDPATPHPWYVGGFGTDNVPEAFAYNGTAWSRVTDSSNLGSNGGVSAISGAPGAAPYFLTGWDGVVRTSPFTSPVSTYYDLFNTSGEWGMWVAPNDGQVFGAGPFGALFRDDVNQTTGYVASSTNGSKVTDLNALPNSIGYAAGTNGLLLRRTTSGWQAPYFSSMPRTFAAVAGTDATHAAAVCNGGVIDTWNGTAWSVTNFHTTCSGGGSGGWYDVLGFQTAGDPEFYAAGSWYVSSAQATLLRFTIAGDCEVVNLTNAQFDPTNITFYSIDGSSSTDLYLVGSHATVLHVVNDAATVITPPTDLSSPDTFMWQQVLDLGDGGIYVRGTDYASFPGTDPSTKLYAYDGGTWTPLELTPTGDPSPIEIQRMHLDDTGRLWLLGDDNSLYVHDGETPKKVFMSHGYQSFSALHGVGTDLWLGGDYRTILRGWGYEEE
ncbi:MAG: hypothetical protein A2284_07290 [Deltaproteobacteria bacterium RIFOXYA12_FULL_61_11]|nr:MAG: hypothetical protein A2284_07290 [Deltaproteobacteria bacterium RIFOXYA12_FULL_61_11]